MAHIISLYPRFIGHSKSSTDDIPAPQFEMAITCECDSQALPYGIYRRSFATVKNIQHVTESEIPLPFTALVKMVSSEHYSCQSIFMSPQAPLTARCRPFNGDQLWMRLYWRPPDGRARILIMAKDRYGEDLHYCMPVVNLKAIRDRSSIQLCRARRDGTYILWARLNFVIYERE